MKEVEVGGNVVLFWVFQSRYWATLAIAENEFIIYLTTWIRIIKI